MKNITTSSMRISSKRNQVRSIRSLIFTLIALLFAFETFGQGVTVTVRFANPQLDFASQTYKVDVEFQANEAGKRLFGKNIRFFYDDSVLEFLHFTDYAPGYAAVAPNPAIVSTGSAQSGPTMFTFTGACEYVNGAIQLVNSSATPTYISTSGWTKLYAMMFHVDDFGSSNNDFCPSIVWDMEVDPANGSFLPGSDGVVITVVAPPPLQSVSCYENVVQFNWQYTVNGGTPYGFPVNQQCVNLSAAITANNDDFSANQVNGCIGKSNVGNVLANDLFNGAAVNPDLVMVSVVDNGGLNGVEIGFSGQLSVPANTPSGQYLITYNVCEISFPANCVQAVAEVAVFENSVTCPGNIQVCELDLPLTLGDGDPAGGQFYGEFTYFDENENAYLFNPTSCGLYSVEYSVTDPDGCLLSCSFAVLVLEAPEPAIGGETEVFSCSQTQYNIEDLLLCTAPQDVTYTWNLIGGGEFISGNTGSSVTIQWDSTVGTSELLVSAVLTGNTNCAGEAALEINRSKPTLAGQIKYWNASENVMPSPYSTQGSNPYPVDYFYITLCKVEAGNSIIEIETVKADKKFEGTAEELLSYFKFDLPVDDMGCDGYLIKVWDGGQCDVFGSNPPAEPGTYLKNNYTFNNWGSVTSTDALGIMMMVVGADLQTSYGFSWIGSNTLTPRYGFHSHSMADVNSSNPYITGGLTSLDALLTARRAVGIIQKFPSSQPGASFSPNFRVSGRIVNDLPAATWPTPFDCQNAGDIKFVHSGVSFTDSTLATDHKYISGILPIQPKDNFINIYYSALGDINASYVPQSYTFKGENEHIALNYEGLKKVQPGEVVDIELRADTYLHLGAMSLSLNFDNSLLEVIDTNYELYAIDNQNGTIKLEWYDLDGRYVNDNEPLLIIKARLIGDISIEKELFTINSDSEIADGNARILDGLILKTEYLTTNTKGISGDDLTVSNYPNPFRYSTTFNYQVPSAGEVTLTVYNNVGQQVATLFSEFHGAGNYQISNLSIDLKPGTYMYRLQLESDGAISSATKTMIVLQ